MPFDAGLAAAVTKELKEQLCGAKIEKIHGNRFEKLANMLKDGCYFQQPEGGEWMCLNCGHIHKGMLVPEVCPVCRREKGFFIPLELAPYMSEELR